MLSKKEMWDAVVNCDCFYDDKFFYGVKTTGIFCRPSCKSKEPLKENVQFFQDINKAYKDGFRPCKRCRPDLVHYKPSSEIALKAKDIYEKCFNDKKNLDIEIKSLGISQNRLIDVFRKEFNMTPIEYLTRIRAEKGAELLATTELSIIDIGLQSGFGCTSSFYLGFKKYYYVTPKEYREARRKGL